MARPDDHVVWEGTSRSARAGDVRLELDRQARPLQPVATLCDLADAPRARDAIIEQADQAPQARLIDG